jgi:hypothetical protein
MPGGHPRREGLKVAFSAPLWQSALFTKIRHGWKGYPGKTAVDYLASPSVIKNIL